tara:strand:+ start:276 stop:521 length:246 start_codon:yes stop_codon:yes gene_type:complete
MAFKMKGFSAFTKNENDENVAYGVKKTDSVSTNKHNEAVNSEMLAYRQAYINKHGSSSGGSDEEWNAYQEGLKNIRSKYIK